MLVFLSDAPAADPATAYQHAQQSFFHGYLGESQREAGWGYNRFLSSAPAWARRFQLLEATAMIWQGLSEDALRTLSDARIPWQDDGSRVEKLAIETTAFTHLHRLDEASATLTLAHQLCGRTGYSSCGNVLRADGLFDLERGQPRAGKARLLQSLDFAREHHDGLLEDTSLLGLGTAAVQLERHDEAIAYFQQAETKARLIGTSDVLAAALGDEGWEEFSVGNVEKALPILVEAVNRSSSVADAGGEVQWLVASGLAYAATGQNALAKKADMHAIVLANQILDEQSIINASEDLARISIQQQQPDEAQRYISAALRLAQQTGNRFDLFECRLLQGQVAALRHDWQRSRELLEEIGTSIDSSASIKWRAQHALGRMYEAKGDTTSAQRSFEAAIAVIETARADLKQEVSQLTFLGNASSIYDDYIHLLVSEGKMQEALEAADWSRARTLQQGLQSVTSLKPHKVSAPLPTAVGYTQAPRLNAVEIARRTNTTLLLYWLGEKQSYLWVITGEATRLLTLPPKSSILPMMERYRLAIQGLRDPSRAGAGEAASDGAALYQMLVAPAVGQLHLDRPMVLLVDGELGQLNFETLLVPAPVPHFWIEDATVLQAPSIRMFAEKKHHQRETEQPSGTMLLLGDAIPAATEFHPLPMAAREMEAVQAYFPGTAKILRGAQATPAAYLTVDPARFEYIHFVAHGTASRTDPLDSAVILSQGGEGEDGYKLYARDILRHPINARLVTISACNSSGSKSFAGEGMIGLSWAFLRAGAHNAIGSLWEVSDASTPMLMNSLYAELHKGVEPAAALRMAKLSLLHSGGHFSRPFYWAPFQLYAGR